MSLEDRTEEERDRLAAMYESIINNPATREMALRATKIAHPKLVIAELDNKDAIAAATKPLQEKIDQMQEEKLREDMEKRVEAQRKALRDQGYSQADVDEIEKLMVSDKIATHETAAKYFTAQRQLAEPTPGTRQGTSVTYALPGDALNSIKTAGKKGLGAWARNEAAAAINDIAAGRIKLH